MAEQHEAVGPGADDHEVGVGRNLEVDTHRGAHRHRVSCRLEGIADEFGGAGGVAGTAFVDDEHIHRREHYLSAARGGGVGAVARYRRVVSRELVGGQALVDGVMVRRGTCWAAATRCPDGHIATVSAERAQALAGLRSVPILRGVGALVDSLRMGLGAMAWSRAQSGTVEDPGGAGATRKWSETLAVAAIVSGVLAVFLLVPLSAAWALRALVGRGWGAALVEGAVRLGLFVGYVAMLSRLPGARRTLQYHGAEHMVIAAFEHEEAPSVDAARRHSTRHPRCGTDFFLLIFVVSIVVFALVGQLAAVWLVASRVVLAPVVVGVAYEILRAGGAGEGSRLGRVFAAPGLWLQRFTTAEPSDSQIEVALAALDVLHASAPSSPGTGGVRSSACDGSR